MDYKEFKKHILTLTGIDLNAYKETQMKRRIDTIIRKNGCEGYQDYLSKIKIDKVLYEAFINYLTINVSEFFRNPSQWVVLEQDIIPMLLKGKTSIKIWSAACSTGDEPYTIAMIMSKILPLNQIKIMATDIDKEVLKKAQEGLYIDKSVANVPKVFLDKYFTKKERMYQISDEIKKCVSFTQHNLLKDPYPNNVDLIVCRNVLIYFTEDAKNEIYKKFSAALRKEGILFVGSTEQIIMSQNFGIMPYKMFFYQKPSQ